MAERGFLPKVLGYRSRHDTPTLGILLSSIGVMAIATLDFVSIVELLNGECSWTPTVRAVFYRGGMHEVGLDCTPRVWLSVGRVCADSFEENLT